MSETDQGRTAEIAANHFASRARQTYIPLMMYFGGYSNATGAAVVSAFSAIVALGRIVGGFLADRVGEINMFTMGCLMPLLATLCIWMPAPTNLGTTVAASMIWAFFCGAPLVTMPVICAQEFGTAKLGAAIGVLYLSFGPGGQGKWTSSRARRPSTRNSLLHHFNFIQAKSLAPPSPAPSSTKTPSTKTASVYTPISGRSWGLCAPHGSWP